MFNKRGKAFECDKCPKNNNPELGNFCPAWWEQAWTEQGQEIIKKDCAFRLLPNMLVVLGATSRLSMTTANELTKRLDAVDEMCKRVEGKMEGLARAFYIAAQRAEYLSNTGHQNDHLERANQHALSASGSNEAVNQRHQGEDGPRCEGETREAGTIGRNPDVDSGRPYGTEYSSSEA